MQNLSETLQHHSKSQSQRLEELSSSGSSNLAISISNEERLKNIECMMGDLIDTISATSSQSNSQKSSKVAMDPLLDQRDDRSYQLTLSAASKRLSADFSGSVGESNASDLELYGNLDSQSSLLSDSTNSQLSLLSESTKILARGTAQWFPPTVSEYILALCASRTLEIYANILVFPAVSVDSRERSALSDRMIKAARRIRSLRDICRAENLEHSLDLADGLLSVDVEQIEKCEELANQELTDEGKPGVSIIGTTDHNQRSMDRTTRINEWLLGVLQAKKNETSLHKAIVQDFPGHRDRYGTDESFEKEWPRLVLKYWFQDHAGESSREQPMLASSTGWDSNRTAKQRNYAYKISESMRGMAGMEMALKRGEVILEGFDLSVDLVMLLQPDLSLTEFHGYVEEDEDASLLKEGWCGPKLADEALCEVVEE